MTEPAARGDDAIAAPARSSAALKVGVGVALGAVAVAALVVSPVTLFALVLGLCLVALGELYRIVRRLGAVPMPVVGFAAIGGLFALAYRGPETLLAGLPGVTAAAVVAALVVPVARARVAGSLATVASTVSCAVYVGVGGAFIVAMRGAPGGFRVTLAFGLMVCLNDAFAFFAGRAFGRRPMAPSISPDKTWEGAAGGAAATVAVAAIAAWRLDPPFDLPRAMLLAALVAVAVPLGDLAESALKRDAGVKDSGEALRGHGGVLDRLDGLLFAAPVFYLAYRAMVR